MNARMFAPQELPKLLDFVSNNAKARLPSSTYLMTSDVAWGLPGADPTENIRLWYDDIGLAGYVWFEPTTGMGFDLRADLAYDRSVARDMLAWGESKRREFRPAFPRFVELESMAEWEQAILHPRAARPEDGLCLTATAFEQDGDRIAVLERSGFRATKHFEPKYQRSLQVSIPEAKLPEGMKLRHVTEHDLEERVAVHRDSWTGSSWDLPRYHQIRASDVYDPELDIVLETGDGTFASYCIFWIDRVVGVGSLEPMGTRRRWTGRGLGREVVYEGLRRLKSKGMHSARVGTAGFNKPAQALYQSCGFETADILRTFMKRLDES